MAKKPPQYETLDSTVFIRLYKNEKAELIAWGLKQHPRLKLSTVARLAIGDFLNKISKDQLPGGKE